MTDHRRHDEKRDLNVKLSAPTTGTRCACADVAKWFFLVLMLSFVCYQPSPARCDEAAAAADTTDAEETEQEDTQAEEFEESSEDPSGGESPSEEETPSDGEAKSEGETKPVEDSKPDKPAPPADTNDDSDPKEEAPSEAPQDDNSSTDSASSDEKAEDEKPKEDKPEEDKPQEDKAEEEKPKEDTAKDKTAEEEKAKPAEAQSEPSETQETKNAEQAQPAETAETTVEMAPTKEVDPPKPPPAETKEPEQTKKPNEEKCIIGSTATLLEKQSGLKFRARVDTGAKSCSLHVEKIEIQDASTKEDVVERMTENIGKVITFVVKNGEGKTHILKRKIATYVIIKTSNKAEGKRRYKVPLTFLWKNMEKEVLVTLNDRQHMDYPLLLGRNFLHGDFLVDVELNSDD